MAVGPVIRIVSGKGGVGKTLCATTLALAEARAGARVLLVELHGRDAISGLLGVEPAGYKMREVFDNLWLSDINPQDAIHEYVLLTLRFEALYKAVFENRLVRHFIRLVPSLSELVMLGKVWYHAQEQIRGRRRFDRIIVDAPATGHARALLRAPRAVADSVPPGPMRDNARLIDAMLTDPATTRLHVVTTPEDMPVTEALELLALERELGIVGGTLIINGRTPPLPEGALEAVRPL
ncbi:MAG TPA: ArsA-related P-loop ATPase, partial [Myxococcota bacterium]|nr:ArsA-related P-loop ATPase [Myxococcota bacterium]